MVKRHLIPGALSVIQCIVLLLLLFSPAELMVGQTSPRIIHVFVALCDNAHQGIIPVPAKLGNGDDPENNLYWGARYGVKAFFKNSNEWGLVSTRRNLDTVILERCIFKHRLSNVYLVADAYRGIEIKKTVIDFLESAAGNHQDTLSFETGTHNTSIPIGGSANLVTYVGHDGLMDFQLDAHPKKKIGSTNHRDAIILACVSKSYFSEAIRASGVHPLLWTTGLMAPEAYTLEAAVDGWILNETGNQIRTRAAQAYHQYQKCSLDAAKRLFVTGW